MDWFTGYGAESRIGAVIAAVVLAVYGLIRSDRPTGDAEEAEPAGNTFYHRLVNHLRLRRRHDPPAE